jgi:ANTAR domain-containing protein
MSATDGLNTAPDGDEQQRITRAVSEIIERRAVIQQTVGMMMVIYDLDADQAFELLKWISQTNNVKLRILAERLGSELPLVARNLTRELRSACDKVLLAQRVQGSHVDALPTSLC